MSDNYMDRKREEDRQRYELICEYIEQGKPISVSDRRFYALYRMCIMKKGEK